MACGLVAGTELLPGGRVHETSKWVVEHCIGPLGLGTLVVKPLRHVVHVADLTEEESAELGPLLQRVGSAVSAIMKPEQVYVCLWSHSGAVPGHIHFVVQPALADDLARHNAFGPALQMAWFDAGVLPDTAEIVDVCARLRIALNATDQSGGYGSA